jgi:hypothetical protein
MTSTTTDHRPDHDPRAPVGVPRTWTITTDTGFTISGHLPPWATDDPSAHQVPIDQLGIALSDINHHQDVCGQTLPLPVNTPNTQDQDDQAVPVFCGSIDCDPYATEPELRTPVFNYHIEALAPDDITRLATLLRTHADELDHHVRPALVQARNDWEHNNPHGPV